MENGEIILRTGDPCSMVVSSNITQAAGSEDMLFVLQGHHTLAVMNRIFLPA